VLQCVAVCCSVLQCVAVSDMLRIYNMIKLNHVTYMNVSCHAEVHVWVKTQIRHRHTHSHTHTHKHIHIHTHIHTLRRRYFTDTHV